MRTSATTQSGAHLVRKRGHGRLAALTAVVALFGTVFAPFAGPASAQVPGAGIGLSIAPIFPEEVTVGETGVPGGISITNGSVNIGPVLLTEIKLAPSCSDPTSATGCVEPELGVIDLSPTAIGISEACAGVTFIITGPDAAGRFTFTPLTPVTLQPPGQANDGCVLQFTFDVLRAPEDADPVAAGIQSRVFAQVTATGRALDNPEQLETGTGTGTRTYTVLLATPTINTVATPAAILSQPISDTAVVTGPDTGPPVTGTVTFTLFGPANPTCAGAPIFTSTQPLVPGPAGAPNDATANSGPFTPTRPGEYRWVVVYSGDANNMTVTSPCGAPNEISQVNRPVAAINTVATPSATVGGPISDTATVTGPAGFQPHPTGTVTFTLFNNDTCTGAPVFTSTTPLNGNTAVSGPFTPGTTGVFNWVATFNGDAIFAPVTAPCGAPNETSNILAAQPDINTVAPATAPLGTEIRDVATLSGGFAPTGTITFRLFGPDDELCAGPPVFTSVVPVNGNGDYTSGPFTPPEPGTYFWIAAYSGDANNNPVAGVCGEPGEITQVFGPPLIQVVKTATPTTRIEPGGTFTFDVVVTNTGPNSLTITSLVDSVYGNLATRGNCAGIIGDVLAADPDGSGPVSGGSAACAFDVEFIGQAGDSETDVVTVIGTDEIGQTATDDDDATINITDVAPNIQVEKTASPETMPEPGGFFTFTVVVTNTSIEPVTITDLDDDIYGDLNGRGTCAVGAQLPANGGTYTCAFPGEFLGTAEGPGQTDVVTVIGVDDDGTTVTDEDDATVGLTDVLPTVQVVKTADPLSLPEPGGTFTFTVVVTNTSVEPVRITALTDDRFGNLATQGTCTTAIGRELPVGGTYTCEFEGDVAGNAGDDHTNIVTVVVEDDEENPATDTDDAVVTLTPVPPTVQVVKTATPESRPAPGGQFTFLVVVTNTSAENVTITTLTDSVHGNIATQGTCVDAIGTELIPGGTYTCSFTGTFTGSSGSERNVVTVVVTDDDDETATDDDDATVTITPVTPPTTPPTRPPVVANQNVTPRANPAPVAQVARVAGTSSLPKTGAGFTDLLTLALGLVAFGGLLVLTASRWAPAARIAGSRRRNS